ncbi:hypothetical protein OIU76_005763 [Salix suchowensis]|nr:hypothetical protein OIU76_005763 [Salix suchowensis]
MLTGSTTTTFSKWHAHERQESLRFLIGVGSGCDANIHSPGLTNCIKINLWEHSLVANSNAVVALLIKAVRCPTLEIPCPRQPQVNKSI